LDEDAAWTAFAKDCLQSWLEVRNGSLCREKQFEKQKESRFLSMFDDDEDGEKEDLAPIDSNIFGRSDDYGGQLED
jgi:hypothetical protein